MMMGRIRAVTRMCSSRMRLSHAALLQTHD
jgi:hypothetical protein